MIKLFVLITAREDFTTAQFHAYWRDRHGPLGRRIAAMRRYRQSHRLAHDDIGLPSAPYDGVGEAWFDDLAAVLGLASDPAYTEHAQRDEPNFVRMDRMVSLMTQDQVLLDCPAESPPEAVKLIQLIRRPEGAEHDGWRGDLLAGGDLAVSLGAVRHTVSLCLPAMYADGQPPYDAVRELSWPDRGAFDRARRDDPSAWDALNDPALVDPAVTGALLATEHPVI